ncbi:hypothetical protein [Hymenobacter cellulosilyticus]|uniref:DUF3592 domain-containing protein n=1 Tax=Hymenobacter cellulosilyticus TaxID=2932248 RepID=A0A8T9Q5W4_9BACT|nr:hypothetical protein [Hymenobacter cellulosilyticus]UOQ70849.1 hypothetical protein MUN79_19485 [Hymenobacter cellulosilyticus]
MKISDHAFRIILIVLSSLVLVVTMKKCTQEHNIEYGGVYERAYIIDSWREGKEVNLKFSYTHHGKKHIEEISTSNIKNQVKKGDSIYVKLIDGFPEQGLLLYKTKEKTLWQ